MLQWTRDTSSMKEADLGLGLEGSPGFRENGDGSWEGMQAEEMAQGKALGGGETSKK